MTAELKKRQVVDPVTNPRVDKMQLSQLNADSDREEEADELPDKSQITEIVTPKTPVLGTD